MGKRLPRRTSRQTLGVSKLNTTQAGVKASQARTLYKRHDMGKQISLDRFASRVVIPGYLGLGCVIKQAVCALAKPPPLLMMSGGPGNTMYGPTFLHLTGVGMCWVTYLALPLTLPGFYS